MSLLNYTTKIDVEKTIGEITKMLSKRGAQSILTDYADGLVTALKFTMKVGDTTMGFKLPSDYRPVLEVLKDDSKVPWKLKTDEQAVRVAWRIIKDWVEAQMALVDTKMVKTEEVFLPYAMMKNGKTLAENVQSDPKFMLGAGN